MYQNHEKKLKELLSIKEQKEKKINDKMKRQLKLQQLRFEQLHFKRAEKIRLHELNEQESSFQAEEEYAKHLEEIKRKQEDARRKLKEQNELEFRKYNQ